MAIYQDVARLSIAVKDAKTVYCGNCLGNRSNTERFIDSTATAGQRHASPIKE
ncbi:hypothetical protein MCOR34_011219 [Pyricularia oryzae]|nr:hypothetical protein MCOR34_011219 [Pyricularia oryzae]